MKKLISGEELQAKYNSDSISDFKGGWAENEAGELNHQASEYLQQTSSSAAAIQGNGNGKVVEEIEMKRQLWLKSCRAGDTSENKKTYGSAFVAPGPLIPRKSSSKLFGAASDDTKNLLDEMI